jgi:hypothetical protein
MRVFASILAALAVAALPVPMLAKEAPDIEHHIERTASGYEIVWPDGTKAVKGQRFTPLIINGSIVDADVIIERGRTLAPVRSIVERLGGELGWDEDEQKVTIKKGKTAIEMVIGSLEMKVDGVLKEMDVAPMIYQGCAYLPIRVLSECLGAEVSWISSGKLVEVVSANVLVDQPGAESAISAEEALAAYGELVKKWLPDFKKAFEPEPAQELGYDGVALYKLYQNIEFESSNARVTSEASRYYTINGFLLFDKRTGDMYQRVVIGSSESTLAKIDQDSFEGCSWLFYRHLGN